MPTRITSNTATLIDDFFTNNIDNQFYSGLLFTDISDHLPIFCVNQDYCSAVKDNDYFLYATLGSSDWANITEFSNPNDAYI
jgi:hypothetical protein